MCCTYSNTSERGPYQIVRDCNDDGVAFALVHRLTGLCITKEWHAGKRLFASMGLRKMQALLNTKAILDGVAK